MAESNENPKQLEQAIMAAAATVRTEAPDIDPADLPEPISWLLADQGIDVGLEKIAAVVFKYDL